MSKFTKGKTSAFFFLAGIGLITTGIGFLLGIDILGTVGSDSISEFGLLYALMCFIIGAPFTFIGYLLFQSWLSSSGRTFIFSRKSNDNY